MTDPLQVTPDELRATSEHLAAVSSQMKNVLSSLQSKLSNEGEPWGNDKTGHAFAEGPNGYLAQQDWVNKSIDAKTQLLDQYAGQLKNTADSLQQQDQS
jgi:uncharacterized protein YukE